MTQESKHRTLSASYQLFMLGLCLYALAALAGQSAIQLEARTRRVLDYADCVVCVMFFADFVVSLLGAPNRWRYFVTWGWLDLISSIPMIDVTRWGRAARIVRVLRVLRGLRATKLLANLVLQRRGESAFLAVSLLALLLIVFCSIAVLHSETDRESNIKTAEDALWWAFATITTVGYGDCYPVTWEGRLVATILMCAGVGLFGVFSGFLAAWFIGSEPAHGSSHFSADVHELREEVAALRRALEQHAQPLPPHQRGGTEHTH